MSLQIGDRVQFLPNEHWGDILPPPDPSTTEGTIIDILPPSYVVSHASGKIDLYYEHHLRKKPNSLNYFGDVG